MRVLTIGDIHGCLYLFNDLLDRVRPAADDRVIVLGDMVDRGPDTHGVLNRLIELKRSGMRLVCLRRNHEIMMLAARSGGSAERKTWLSVGGCETLGSYAAVPGMAGSLDDIPGEHWDFLDYNLLDYYETQKHIFVHAGVHRDLPLDEQPDYMLYWEFLPDEMRHHSGKTVICGHTSQKSGEIKVVPGAVCIDTHAHGGGWLTRLDADTGKCWQVNQLGKTREGYVDFA